MRMAICTQDWPYKMHEPYSSLRKLKKNEARVRFGLPSNADEDSVRKRVRKFAKQYHPDLGGDAEMLIEPIQEAGA